MRKRTGFNVEMNNRVKTLCSPLALLAMLAHADEPPAGAGTPPATPPAGDPPATPPTQAPVINYEDLISKARKEEKDKLYPKITALEQKVTELTEKHNSALLTIGQREEEMRQLQTNNSNSTIVADLQDKLAKAEAEVEKLKKNKVDRKTIEEEIRAEVTSEFEVKLYREQKLREIGKGIIPELVTGTTKEEVDASVETAKKRYTEIVGQVYDGANITLVNPPDSKLSMKDVNLEDLAKMNPASPEYKALRAKLGLK